MAMQKKLEMKRQRKEVEKKKPKKKYADTLHVLCVHRNLLTAIHYVNGAYIFTGGTRKIQVVAVVVVKMRAVAVKKRAVAVETATVMIATVTITVRTVDLVHQMIAVAVTVIVAVILVQKALPIQVDLD